MKPFSTLLLCAGALGLLPAALYLADGMFARQQSPALRKVRLIDGLQQFYRGEQLDADRAILYPSVLTREGILRELIEGRLTLRAAAAVLREQEENKPPHLRIQPDRLPGQSTEDYFLQRALRGAENQLEKDPRRERILARLRGELQDYRIEQDETQP